MVRLRRWTRPRRVAGDRDLVSGRVCPGTPALCRLVSADVTVGSSCERPEPTGWGGGMTERWAGCVRSSGASSRSAKRAGPASWKALSRSILRSSQTASSSSTVRRSDRGWSPSSTARSLPAVESFAQFAIGSVELFVSRAAVPADAGAVWSGQQSDADGSKLGDPRRKSCRSPGAPR